MLDPDKLSWMKIPHHHVQDLPEYGSSSGSISQMFPDAGNSQNTLDKVSRQKKGGVGISLAEHSIET